MSILTRLMGQRGDIVRSGVVSRDALNNPVRGEISRVTTRVRLEQGTTSEVDDSFTSDTWQAYFPKTVDIRAGDTFESGGRRLTVEGSPRLQSVPGIPGADHVQAQLRYVGEV